MTVDVDAKQGRSHGGKKWIVGNGNDRTKLCLFI